MIPEPEECVDGVCQMREESEEVAQDEAGDNKAGADEHNITNEDNDHPGKITPSQKVRKKKVTGNTSSSLINIQSVHSQQALNALVSTNEAVVVEFMTSWCGACKGIAPYYEELASSHADLGVQSAQVLCDKNRETKKLAAAYGVTSYPVFVMFENGNDVGKWNGADRGKLEKAFERLSGSNSGRGGAKGRRKKKWRG
jgi:thiol-disulfide isomerase/thioredoxin